jgi:hypothetical protein
MIARPKLEPNIKKLDFSIQSPGKLCIITTKQITNVHSNNMKSNNNLSSSVIVTVEEYLCSMDFNVYKSKIDNNNDDGDKNNNNNNNNNNNSVA